MELDFIHEELITEENVNVNDLPESIRRKIKGFNLLNSRLKSNPENEKIKNTVQRTSVDIADEIQNWLELDLEEDEEVDTAIISTPAPKNNGTPSAPAPVRKTETHSTATIPNSNPMDNSSKRFGNLVMEKKILAFLNANGDRIDTKTLTNIIGREPNYPAQEVYGIVLKKVFLSSSYKLA